MPKVFISYSSKDRNFAQKLKGSLENEGITVWLDEKELLIGDSIIEKIGTAIQTSDFVIAVLSNSSVKSQWVQKELMLAVTREQEERGTFVLPVVIESCDIPSFLKDKLYADFTDTHNFIKPLNRLIAAISAKDIQVRCEFCKNRVPLSSDRCPHCARLKKSITNIPPRPKSSSVTTQHLCVYCNNTILPNEAFCLHCGRPSLFPNVWAAEIHDEREALSRRYEAAIEDAKSRGFENIVRHFESEVAKSKAVVTISINELNRLAGSNNELYSSYFRLIGVQGARELTADDLSVLRALTDEALFSGYKQHIRFAALSLDGIGVSNYGECSVVLRDDLIAHRTTVFEENPILFMKSHNTRIWKSKIVPLGYRATWSDRAKLCVAKLAREINANTQPIDFPRLLLRQGKTVEDDSFIETHIYGPLTVRAIERVILPAPQKNRPHKALLKNLIDWALMSRCSINPRPNNSLNRSAS